MTTAARSRDTRTGGRAATTRHIPPTLALAVGMPTVVEPSGWQWRPLSELARLESGHTPSRQHPEYWGGDVPWISIPDAKRCHGDVVNDTEESTNALGIANSSARLIPAGAVCLSRTASVGYVAITGRPMATSQDFVNWICGDLLLPEFLQHLFIAEGENLLRFASGAVHKTIYFPEVKAFHVCVPDVATQRRIVAILDEAIEGIATAKANAEKNLRNARVLLACQSERLFADGTAECSEQPLETVASIVNGFAFKSADFSGKPGLKCIKITNVGVGEFVAIEGGLLPFDFAGKYGAFAAAKGSIVLALTRTIIGAGLKVAVVPEEFGRSLVNQRVAAITARQEKVTADYLFAYLRTGRVRAYVQGSVNTLMQPNLSIVDLRRLPVPVPPIAAQERLVESLALLSEQVDGLASVYHRKMAALDELKKSLLHQAFSGTLQSGIRWVGARSAAF